MVTDGVDVYWLPLLIIEISVTAPFSIVANADAVSPLGPVGASIVTVGAWVYPVPPEPTVILSTDLNSWSK